MSKRRPITEIYWALVDLYIELESHEDTAWRKHNRSLLEDEKIVASLHARGLVLQEAQAFINQAYHRLSDGWRIKARYTLKPEQEEEI